MSAAAATPDDVLPVIVRELRDTDWHFVCHSWSRNTRLRSRSALRRAHSWYEELRVRGTRFLVAANPEDEDQIFGWVCFEDNIVHYIFVKPIYRDQGIARSLFAGSGLTSTTYCVNWNPLAQKISNKHPNTLRRLQC